MALICMVILKQLVYYRQKFRSQTSDNMDRWKAEMGRVREEKRREEKRRRKKIQVCEKVAKSRNTVFFPMSCGSGRSKSRLTGGCEAMWSDERWQVARRCGAKRVSKSKCTKHLSVGARLEVEMSKQCTPLWREAHFQVKSVKALLDVQMSFRVAGARDCAPCQKWAKTWGMCSMSKNDGRRGTFEEDLQTYLFRGRRSTRDMFIRDVRRSGRWFPEKGCILEHQIFSFGKMILLDRCSTSYELASIFCGKRNTLDKWSGKIAKPIGTRPSALHSTFHFWRKSRRIALFLTLPTSKKMRKSRRLVSFLTLSNSKIKEVLQNCSVFLCCQVQKLRTSRRIASFVDR